MWIQEAQIDMSITLLTHAVIGYYDPLDRPRPFISDVRARTSARWVHTFFCLFLQFLIPTTVSNPAECSEKSVRVHVVPRRLEL